ncbi:hypothetical protein COU57_04945 [Candidatus Pacearchaeota archaeon CG10_big_fil_rev_8_21_14_0_10_32_14]|nr:MAG: hypothetical protein COU57_04945 [Candidatus Pacearchaeota archaeon CG10_big_fil_rev_8_21_14_0_10_32_14]
MNNKKLDIYYDIEADILEITIGESSSCIFDEVDDDLYEARDEKTNELKGYKIFNFLKRGGFEDMNKIKIHLPANVNITS